MSEHQSTQAVAPDDGGGQGMGMDYKRWSRTARRARLAPVLILVTCALILLGIAAMDRFHAFQFEQSMRPVREFEQIRSRLSAGFLRLTTEADTLSTADLELERTSLLQDLQRVQNYSIAIRTGSQGISNTLDALAVEIGRQLNSSTRPAVAPSARPSLQSGFWALDAEMVRLEAVSAQQLDGLLQRQQMRYSIGWLMALGAMALLGLGVAGHIRDVRAAQMALRESEAKSQRYLNMLPQLVWICDVNARVEYFNERWVEFSGVPMQTLLEEGWAPLMHPDDLAPLLTQWDLVAHAGASSLPEFRLRRHDGIYRWFSARFSVSHNEHGQPVRWFGSSIDIEDIRMTRAALEQSERFHRETMGALTESVVTFDTTLRATGCNPSAERFFGMTRKAMVGLPLKLWDVKLMYEDGSEMSWDDTPVSWVLKTGEASRDVLLQALRRGDETKWLLVNAEPLRNDGGGIATVVTSFRDITDSRRAQMELLRHQEGLEVTVAERTQALTTEIAARAQAEKQLQALNAQLLETERFNRMVADNVPGRIAYWDQQVRCQFANRTYCEWWEIAPSQIIGRTMQESLGEAYFESLKPHIMAALRGEPQDFERSEYSRQGLHVVSHKHFVPDYRDGQVRGFFVLSLDITQQKRSAQLLQQANAELAHARDQAMSANQAKSAFLANMSHEIRTPMNAIVGFTYMLRRDIRDPVQQQRLAKIGTAANHLLQVINDILDLSKIESGKLVLESVDFSLDTLLSRTFSMVTESARDKGLELVVDIVPLPDRLRGDPTRLMQALLNLLNNAVKFTEQGSVSLRVVVVEQDTETMLVRFEVLDTGIGIAPQEFARLFNPFAQADASSSRLHLGTGLGLAIVRHIAEQMGGEAGGESELGRGSKFWFTARLARVANAQPLPVKALRGLRALVADDLPQAREALCAMLSGMELRVDSVASGTMALEFADRACAQQDPYQVVLLDWNMPGLDGLETGVRMSECPDPPQALVLVSMRDHISMHQLARDAGFGAALTKPVTPSALLNCLMRLLNTSGISGSPPESSQPVDYKLDAGRLGARVLLAEDNPVNQEVAIQLLTSAGLVVDLAGDGQQAVQMVHAQPYDLVLMDVQMPRMDGLQATRLIRADPAFAALPIIAMTANALPQDREACLDAGMNEHLAKPVDPRLLHLALLRWLPGGRGAASPVKTVAEIEPPNLRQKLAPLAAVVDLDVAYEYCAGLPDILIGVMQTFVEHYAKAGEMLERHLDVGETQAAARLLHSLRGVSGTIGAKDILASTRLLELAIQEGVAAEELLSQARTMHAQLDSLVSAISECLKV